MNYVDLFSGIGGFALGAYWAGARFDRHFFSEIDPWCVDLYGRRFPEARALGGIQGIATEELSREFGNEWVLTGGFPCQDISIAGKGAGLAGERSGLWWEYWRLIRDLRPAVAIMENVGALAFRGLDSVLGSLAEVGYDAEWADIRASDIGAPHRRERIWIVAYPGGERHESIGISGILDGARRAAEGEGLQLQRRRDAADDRREGMADADGGGFEVLGKPEHA
ncbi:MAG: DNA cytosine methyltransferase, partial [Rectinemataceae bacterium]